MRALQKFKSKSQLINTTSVVDRHRFDADPDLNPTFHFDADPDPDTTSFIHKFEYFLHHCPGYYLIIHKFEYFSSLLS